MSRSGSRRRSILVGLTAVGATQLALWKGTGAQVPGGLREDYSALLANLVTGEIQNRGQSPDPELVDQPGSIIKVVTAAVALDQGVTNASRRISCPGWLDPPAHLGLGRLPCWDPSGHGSLSLVEALSLSCNTYFYQLGLELGLRQIQEGLALFGIDGDDALVAPWVAAGEDPTLKITLDQALQLAILIASRGHGHPSSDLGPKIWDLIHAGMISAVEEGTGRGIAPSIVTVAAKTGTLLQRSQLGSTQRNQPLPFRSWVIAFWPSHTPQWAMALRLNRGRAYAEAIPIARHLISSSLS